MVTLPNPNPIPNAGYLDYQYEVTPGTTLPGAINSNTVYTQVNRAIIQNESGGLTKSLDKTYVILGDTITYTVVLKNTGNVDAVSVIFKDTIPGYTSYIAGSATVNGVASGTTPDVGLSVGTIAPNGVATVIFKVLVNSIPPAGSNTIPNSALINYDFVYDPTTPSSSSASNLSNTVESYVNEAVISNVDGGLVKAVDKLEADVLDVLTYTITIKNTGNVSANNVTLKDTIPQGTVFQSNNVTIDGTNTSGNPSTGISLGSLASGQTKVVVFTVSVTSIPNPNKADNQAIIDYNYTKDPASVNGATAKSGSNVVTTTIVTATIDTISGGLVKSVDKSYAAVGETITYTIKVQNTGNISADNVIFTDTVPTDTTLVDVSVDGSLVGGGNPTTGINLGNIGAGSVKTVTIRVTVNTIPAINPIPNSGKIAYDYTVNGAVKSDQNLTNIVSTTVAQASITNGSGGLIKSTPKTNGKVGDVIPYTIVLKNTGNVNATSVLFKDTVPSGTTLNAGTLKLNGSAAP
ncbi:MAG: DUF7507 domain-containing protein, partial [Clostridium sp.]|uniref:DUF7507 domain-containing protein n=1 Tax=Clostridium sp. TaxID=1506 RepID=UPI003F354FD7